ncbi:MAG: hypothetical protein A2087_03975 [Spirochaetes bacterium GWD1_61_31]|nr:MAG: hypothetical protein A2Y37_04985 [Spirochaetes bacterium GWB1_60_80]OHD32488.1 MAG: hypothetical protein A2004_12200 [Spirochaetes bacterium GWC1_61_12]OHD42733.1 MAG: hypothetical protein A2087_03975 [Spirochaetes bacterium GWD1_61_31]OHD43729.1 MAG: hypothetical protein A2Y35_00175 [Spirochaetes bacterium GWE1_60_18]OHD60214.1 MAG: hypothetical protein A2Y32_07225 [Spirochaetes bacterium GWF1_60_12]
MKRFVNQTVSGLALLRGLALLLLLLALFNLRPAVITHSRALVLLLDVSGSIKTADRERARQAATALLEGLEETDRAAIILFAADPLLLTGLTPPAAALSLLSVARLELPQAGATNLESALLLAHSVLADANGERLLVLASDGQTTAGASAFSPEILADGQRILVLPLGQAAAGSPLALGLPEFARPGENVSGTISLRPPEAGDYRLAISVDGQTRAERPLELDGSPLELPFSFLSGASGQSRVDVSLLDDSGATVAANTAMVELSAAGTVLVLTKAGAAPSPLAGALAAQGIAVRTGGSYDLPADSAAYAALSCVVLDDIAAAELNAAALQALTAYVSSGGGLLVSGGTASLGRGAYFESPLADLLPVDTDLRKRLLFTRARLLFVIDSSGSMFESAGHVSKQEAAMQAVAAALEELNPQDEFGILSFDSQPKLVQSFSTVDRREEALAALSTMNQGGGTDLQAALLEAMRLFGPPGPIKRHMIIFSDGITASYEIETLAARLTDNGITVSTIAIGRGANVEDLEALAKACGGNFYRAEQDELPRISSTEAASLSRDLIMEGQFIARPSSDSPFSGELAVGLPPFRGYLLTRARPLADVHLSVDNAAGAVDPLLAEWHYGAGRVAVFTADSGARWLSGWLGTPAYTRLWASLVRRIEKPAAASGLQARVQADGADAHIVVEALSNENSLARGLRVVGNDPDGNAFLLEETAPGRYEARLSAREGFSLYEIRVDSGWSDGPPLPARTSAWFHSAGAAESAGSGRDDATLQQLVDLSGGGWLEPASPQLPPAGLALGRVSLRWLFALLAAVLFVFELALRSFLNGRLKNVWQALRAWWRQRRLEAGEYH